MQQYPRRSFNPENPLILKILIQTITLFTNRG